VSLGALVALLSTSAPTTDGATAARGHVTHHAKRVSAARGALFWHGGFETGDLAQWTKSPQEKEPGRITVVSEPSREGLHALRAAILPGDSDVFGSGTGERAEVVLGRRETQGYAGREQWWAWSIRFAHDFRSRRDSDWNYFTQFHNTGLTGQANVHLSANGDRMTFGVCNGTPTDPRCRLWTIDRDRENGRWYDFVLHVRWASSAKRGFVELWENSAEVVPFTRIATLYPGQGVYLKQGIYRTAQANPATIYIDGTRGGSSYGAVVAGFPDGTWTSKPPRPRRHARPDVGR
jgi:hypothetical protein